MSQKEGFSTIILKALGLKETIDGFVSCLIGMKVTLHYMFKPTVTLHYPDQQWIMFKNTRNWLKLTKSEETGEELCTACGSCVRACPCSCIKLSGKKAEHRKGMVPDMFEIDFSLCCFCGLCVDVCPFAAISFCEIYETACYERNNLLWDKEKLLTIKDDHRETTPGDRVSTPYIPKWQDMVDKYVIP